VLIFLIQWGGGVGVRLHTGAANLLEPLVLVLGGAVVGMLGLRLLGLVVPAARRRLRAWRSGRRQVRSAANAERRARAMMSELCPFGWQAQITLFETAGDARVHPGGRGPRAAVALDWAELGAGPGGRPAVMRRVWAPTIAEALEAMVSDRRTDEALEQIEQLAAAEGALWPDLETGSA
jgi:hypothetical protein